MSKQYLIRIAGLVLVFLAACQTRTLAANSHRILFEVKAFEPKGLTEDLEDEILDFRYSPQRCQACTGLPGDPSQANYGLMPIGFGYGGLGGAGTGNTPMCIGHWQD